MNTKDQNKEYENIDNCEVSPASIPTFKYTILAEPCTHYPKDNTAAIFECCDQAYNCYICHNEQADHKMTNSNELYCRSCLFVFSSKGGRPTKCPNCQTKLSRED